MKPNGCAAARRAFSLHHLLLLFNKFNGKSIVPASHENDTQKRPTNRHHHHHCRCCYHCRQRRHGQWRRPRPTVPLFDSVVFPFISLRFYFYFPFHLIMLHFWAHVCCPCLCVCGFGWLRQMLTLVWICAVAGMFIGVWPAGSRDMTKWVIFR